jgi:hypothetical protein
VVGAALTFGFGWLNGFLTDRRQRANAVADLQYQHAKEAAAIARKHAEEQYTVARQSAERRRVEAREHAQNAFDIAADLRDAFEAAKWDARDGQVDFDKAKIRRLRDLGLLLPDKRVRDAVAAATNTVTSARTLANFEGWEDMPVELQIKAMVSIRQVLAAHLRGDEPPASPLTWLSERATKLEKAWEEHEEMLRRVNED